MNTVDQAALELAMRIARRDPATRVQLDDKLKDEDWHSVAEFAAYHCQYEALNLKPWESPPCWTDEDENCSDPTYDFKKLNQAQVVLRRILKAGISRYHPDPLAALEHLVRGRCRKLRVHGRHIPK